MQCLKAFKALKGNFKHGQIFESFPIVIESFTAKEEDGLTSEVSEATIFRYNFLEAQKAIYM